MWLIKYLRSILVVFFLFVSAHLYAINLDEATTAGYTEIYLAVNLNGEARQEFGLFLQDASQKIYAGELELQQWQVNLPDAEPVVFNEKVFYALDAFPGLSYEVDQKNLSILMTIPPSLFNDQNFSSLPVQMVIPTEPNLGGYLNYSVFGQQINGDNDVSGFFMPALFSQYGTVSSEFLAQPQVENNDQVLRLATTWEKDFPLQMRSLVVGDTITEPSMWGYSVLFGGIQWGTNFNTQPSFITFPQPVYSGEARVPSTIDLYFNNAMIGQENVSAGPFAIDAIPVVSGSGDIQVVTTDLLGRQQTTIIPYYAANNLLKPGLVDYSVSMGFLREDFGFASNNYGPFTTVLNQRKGFTDQITAEWRGELLAKQQTLGAGVDYLIGNFAVMDVATASSSSDNGQGQLFQVGLQRTDYGGLSYGFNTVVTTPEFMQLGFELDEPAPSFIGQFFAGTALPDGSSIGATYTQQNERHEEEIFRFISATYNSSLFDQISYNASVLIDVDHSENNAAYLSFTYSFGLNNASVGVSSQSKNTAGTMQLSRNLPLGPGWGYDLYSAQGDQENYQGTLRLQNDIGGYSLSAARQYGETGYQVEADGAAVFLGNKIHLTRELYNSFAMVQIPGYSGVRVYVENQEIGTTDEDGNAFVTYLLPYQYNTIRVEPNDFPISAELKTDRFTVVPYLQSGLVVQFPVESSNPAIAHLTQSSGAALPAGTQVYKIGDETVFPVAEKGEVFLTNLIPGENDFIAQSDDINCQFAINYEFNPNDPLPDLGTIECRGH